MTESVTPREERLVDPETGETPPLSPQRKLSITQAYERSRGITLDQFLDAATLGLVPEATRKAWLYGEWDEYEREIAAHLEPDDAA